MAVRLSAPQQRPVGQQPPRGRGVSREHPVGCPPGAVERLPWFGRPLQVPPVRSRAARPPSWVRRRRFGGTSS